MLFYFWSLFFSREYYTRFAQESLLGEKQFYFAYEFKKCSINVCEGGKIRATRPQMWRLESVFSSSFNLLSSKGVN